MLAFNFRAARQAQQIAQRKAEEERTAAGGAAQDAMEPKAEEPAASASPESVPDPQVNYFKEVQARTDTALNAEIGFVERLVWFWSNHFCIPPMW
jgi:uncharacterized protein (DUF1800 family)